MTIVASYIKNMPKDISFHAFCTGVTRAIRTRYRKTLLPHLAEHPEDRLTASCIVFSRLRRELWLVGDCQALLIPKRGEHSPELIDNPKPYEKELAGMRAEHIKASPVFQKWKETGGPVTPEVEELCAEARESIIPHMVETMQQQNRTYSVLDGFPVAERHTRTITLDYQPWQIVLASDGYPFLCPTLQESEARLQHQLHNDPLNIGPDFMATKSAGKGMNSFDDRAYVRFEV